MTHHPFDAWDFAFPAIAVMFLALSIVLIVFGWGTYHSAAEADQLVHQKRLTSAMSAYMDTNDKLIEKDQETGIWYMNREIKAFHKVGVQGFADTADFISQYYKSTDLKKPWNLSVKKMQKDIQAYGDCYTYFNTAMEDESVKDFKTLMKAYDKELKKHEGYDNAYANYYRYYACLVYNQDTKAQKKYVNAIEKEGKKYANLYLPLYTEIALNDKDYAAAQEYTDKILKLNKEDVYAYTYKAIAYRMSGDLKQAKAAINQGLKIDSLNAGLNYQMAIYAYLDGNLAMAAQYVETAYNYADSVNTFINAGSLSALIAQKRNQPELYDSILTEMEEYGYGISGDVEKILGGKTTFEEIFLKGTGDFTW